MHRLGFEENHAEDLLRYKENSTQKVSYPLIAAMISNIWILPYSDCIIRKIILKVAF
jgi:hypothetical protein